MIIIFLVTFVYYAIGIRYERRRYAMAANDDEALETREKLENKLNALSHTRFCDIKMYNEHYSCDCSRQDEWKAIKQSMRLLPSPSVNYANLQFWPFVILHHYLKSGKVKTPEVETDLAKVIEAQERAMGIGSGP